MSEDLLIKFADNSYVAFITAGLSIVAIAVSLISIVWSNDTSKKLIRIEESRDKQEELHAKTAVLRAHKIENGDTELVIENIGLGSAKNVEVFIDGKPAGETHYFVENTTLKVLGRSSHKQFALRNYLGLPTPELIKITWMNESNKPGEYENSL